VGDNETEVEREMNAPGCRVLLVACLVLCSALPGCFQRGSKDERKILEAAAKGDVKKVETLLRTKPKLVDSRSESGRGLLHLAASIRSLELAELVLRYKAEVNARDEVGETPLHVAAREGDQEVVRLLMVAGADVDAQGHLRNTPLHEAAAFWRKGVAETLLANQAKVNAATRDGSTPLHLAVIHAPKDRQDMVALLLEKGADVNARVDQRTPLSIAQDMGRADLVELLKKHGERQ